MSSSESQPGAASPYRGIEPFRYVDRDNFFGRSVAIEELFAKILLYRLVVLFGESGAGKSSLLNAGLIPTLQKEGLRTERLRVRPDPQGSIMVERIPTTQSRDRDFLPSIFSDGPSDQVSNPTIACSIESFLPTVRASAADSRPLLVFDQFEELFTLFEQKSDGAKELQLEILKALFQIVSDQELRAKVVIVIREDFLGKLEILARTYPQVLDHRVRLRYLPKEDAREAILGPFPKESAEEAILGPLKPGNVFPSRLSGDLADKIVADLSTDTPDGLVAPTQVQIICSRLWSAYCDKKPEIGLDEYEALGGAIGIVRGFFESELQQFDESLRPVAITMLGSLITASNTRDVVSEGKLRDIASQLGLDARDVFPGLRILEARRLINRTSQRGTYFYEVSSEYLIPPILKESRQLAAERAAKIAAAEAAKKERETAQAKELEQAKKLAEEQERRAQAEGLRAEEQARLAATQSELAVKAEALAEEQRQRAESEAHQAKRLRFVLFALALLLLLAVSLTAFAIRSSRVATLARRNAEVAGNDAEVSKSAAVKSARLAEERQKEAEDATNLALGRKAEALQSLMEAKRQQALAIAAKQEAENAYEQVLAAEKQAEEARDRAKRESDLAQARLQEVQKAQAAAQQQAAQAQTARVSSTAVLSVAWSPDGKRLATGGQDRKATVWDAASGNVIRNLLGPSESVSSVAWSPDGRRLATGSGDGLTRIFDTDSGEQLLILRGAKSIYCVVWSPDGTRLAVGSANTTVWDASGRELSTLNDEETAIYSIAWSPDGERLATGSRDGRLSLWDPGSRTKLWRIAAEAALNSVAWRPEENKTAIGVVAVGSDLGVSYVVDAKTSDVIKQFDPNKGPVFAVAWSPDGERLAIGFNNGDASIWDATAGQLVRTLNDQRGTVYSVSWSPDGQQLATATQSGATLIWDVRTGYLLRILTTEEPRK